jgi:BASS family bile acid:Na+ symporter
MMMVSIGTSFKVSEMWKNLRLMSWLGMLCLLLAVFIVPPALALVLARLLHLNLSETGGLFLIGVAPGAPLLTRNIAKRGFDAQLAAVYQVCVALLTPLMIPLLVASAAKLYDRNVWIPPRDLIEQVAKKQFLPLILGMILTYLAPVYSNKLRPILNSVGNVVLYLFMGIILFKMRGDLSKITPWVIVATLLLALGSMAVVPLLVRVEALRERTLSICNANRHVGLALLLSGQYFHSKDSLPTVACYALIAPLMMALYSKGLRPLPPDTVSAAA